MIHKFVSFIILFFLLSCSSEKPTEISSQKPPEAGAGDVSESRQLVTPDGKPYSLEIAPVNASRNSTLHLIPHGFSLSNAKIDWFVNGDRITVPEPDKFKAKELGKGSKVQAKAIINEKEIVSNIVEIKNSPPEISKVRILPEVFKPGDTLYVEVYGSDLDGDELSINYEWTKNDEPAGNDKKIDTLLRRGDKVSVKITPYDGEAYGRAVILHREILNIPPMIIESKKYNFDGKKYTYHIKATDPDGDPLTYSLKSAPAGMAIDSLTGLITWAVPGNFKGKALFTVAVNDSHGGETTQDFHLEITQENR